MTNSTPERVDILNEAAELIVGQRQQDYGTPQDNFERMAKLITIIIEENLRTNTPISARQAADIMIVTKVARTVNSPTRDSYVDIAGYAGIAGELSASPKEEKDQPLFVLQDLDETKYDDNGPYFDPTHVYVQNNRLTTTVNVTDSK